jgi:hypothetical protein
MEVSKWMGDETEKGRRGVEAASASPALWSTKVIVLCRLSLHISYPGCFLGAWWGIDMIPLDLA